MVPKEAQPMTAQEELEQMQRELSAREAHFRDTLEFALDHCDAAIASSAVLGSLGALVQDQADAEAAQMARTGILALIYKGPKERAAAHAWHAHQEGCKPDEHAIDIVDLAREVARTARLYRLTHEQLVTGDAALEAFYSDYLAPRFGPRSPTVKELRESFEKLGLSKSKGGITIAGVVARIIHEGRLMGAHTDDPSKTLRRVDRVLARLANPVK
jgi:hypothetical protein